MIAQDEQLSAHNNRWHQPVSCWSNIWNLMSILYCWMLVMHTEHRNIIYFFFCWTAIRQQDCTSMLWLPSAKALLPFVEQTHSPSSLFSWLRFLGYFYSHFASVGTLLISLSIASLLPSSSTVTMLRNVVSILFLVGRAPCKTNHYYTISIVTSDVS